MESLMNLDYMTTTIDLYETEFATDFMFMHEAGINIFFHFCALNGTPKMLLFINQCLVNEVVTPVCTKTLTLNEK